MNAWVCESMNQCSNESVNTWHESTNQWAADSVKQNVSVNHRDPPSQWIMRSMNQWINDRRLAWSGVGWSRVERSGAGRSGGGATFAQRCWGRLLQSRAHLVELIFQLGTPQFFNIFKCKPSSHYSPVHSWLATLPHRGPHPRKQRPLLRRPQKPHYPKKHRISRPRVFPTVNLHAPYCYSPLLLPHANCSCSLCCWHGAKTAPEQSSVIWKISNYTSFEYRKYIYIYMVHECDPSISL